MATIKVDADGIPYWEPYVDTHLDYTANWSSWVAEVSDTVASATWSASPSGMTLVSATRTGARATIWSDLSAGNANITYTLVSKVFTVGGRSDKLKFKLKVRN